MDNPETFGPWVSVDRYFHPTEAHIAAGRLTSEGIPVNLLGINHASMNWLIAQAMGGIRLQVPAEFVEAASEILASDVVIEESDEESCPNCGSTDTTAHTDSWKFSLLAVHLLNIPVPWRRDRRKCNRCAATWAEQ